MKAVSVPLLVSMLACTFGAYVPAAKAANWNEKSLYPFCSQPNCADGRAPHAGLIDVNGTLYGTTELGGDEGNCGTQDGCGTVFAVDRKTGTERLLHTFCTQPNCADGATPDAGLIAVHGELYGTTGAGGTNCMQTGGCGTIVAIDPKTEAETVLYSFCNQQNCTDGAFPEASLINVDGTLYGTTQNGGAHDGGTIFSIDPNTRAETVLYSFCSLQNCADGADIEAGLVDVKGVFYGTAYEGGAYNGGAVFAVNRKTGKAKVLYSFCEEQNCTDGKAPAASVIDMNGMLYGTTVGGGSGSYCPSVCGTVFSVDPITGAHTVLYSFCEVQNCTDGNAPAASLIDMNGRLVGTTAYGGAGACRDGCGAVFALDPRTDAETVLYSLGSVGDGCIPVAGLIDVNGFLYGTTTGCGDHGGGTAFVMRKPH